MKGCLLHLFSVGLCLFAGGCGGRLVYKPSEIQDFQSRESALRLEFQTRAGKQTAFYLGPGSSPFTLPRPLVIAYPGIRTRALDWLWVADAAPERRAGFLLIDYPGRGLCEGTMFPKYLFESTEGALNALSSRLGIERSQLHEDLRLLGHSFGTAAALQFADRSEPPPRAIVLVAPFTTMHKALFRQFGPLAWLIPGRMDNRKWLTNLHEIRPRPDVTIIHGEADPTLPVAMGRTLAGLFPDWIGYHEIEGADHMTVLRMAERMIFEGLFPD